MKIRKKFDISDIFMLFAFQELENDEIASIIGKSSSSVCHWRKYLGIPKLDYKFTRGKHVENNVTENYCFGWAMGVFATDGYLQVANKSKTTYKRVGLTVTLSDKQHLINFFSVLLSDFNPVDINTVTKLTNTYATHPKVKYICSCPKFIQLLEKYLQFDKKTYDMEIRKCFLSSPDEFKIGFLRGCIDGDGHVSKKCLSIDIVSASEKFIVSLNEYFGGRTKKRKSGNYWDIYFRKNECIELIKQGLVRNNDITLQRKSVLLTSHCNRLSGSVK